MPGTNMRTLAMLLLVCGSLMAAEAKVVNLNWVHGKRIPNIKLCVGDSINFSWRGVQHDLIETKARTCNKAGGLVLFPIKTSGTKVVPFRFAGTRHFMCSVGLHCALGQIVTVTTAKCAGR